MRRREFITLVGRAALAWPLAAQAEEPGRAYRVGTVSVFPRNAPIIVAMLDELRRLGFIEGQNLTIDWRTYGPGADLVSEFEALGKTRPDVIYAGGPLSIRAAQKSTTTIPILGIADDMVGMGLVNSLGRPGGNTTGVSILATELNGKPQEILIEALPGLRWMATLADSDNTTVAKLQALQDAAHIRHVELSIHSIAKAEEIVAAIDMAQASGATALNVLASPLLFANRRLIMDRVAALRLPAIYEWPGLNLYEGGAFPVVATHNAPPAYFELRRRQPIVRPDPSHPLGRVAATKQVLHLADFRTEAGYLERDPSHVAMAELAGARTMLVVPMLK
jgi:putative ABC transport system substrate-binding protein